MKVTYKCAATGIVVEGEEGKLPSGWIIPKSDVSLDIPKEAPKFGTVIAISSEDVWKDFYAKRLKMRMQ